jgi:hypothetical protein
MGKLRSGILGQIRGKVAGVVGGQWKNINYLREFVKPANPNTAAQQVQRTKFADVVAFCKQLVGPIFNTYTDQFLKAMSGFNFFVKQNIAIFDGSPDFPTVLVTEGKLFMGAVTVTDASATTNTVSFTWATSKGSNGLDADAIFACAYNEDVGNWGFMAAEDARDQGGVGSSIGLSIAAGNTIHVWLFAAQRIGTQTIMISNSVHDSDVGA